MSDLREKISDLLDEWRGEISNAHAAAAEQFSPKHVAATSDIADRILALLPKVPDPGWVGHQYRAKGTWGGELLGCYGPGQWGKIDAVVLHRRCGPFETSEEARSAVEAAVRKALGQEA